MYLFIYLSYVFYYYLFVCFMYVLSYKLIIYQIFYLFIYLFVYFSYFAAGVQRVIFLMIFQKSVKTAVPDDRRPPRALVLTKLVE